MRGLTPAERDILLEMSGDAVTRTVRDGDERATLCALSAQGRSVLIDDPTDPDSALWHVAPLGRLALRLWPATKATPGAGDRQ